MSTCYRRSISRTGCVTIWVILRFALFCRCRAFPLALRARTHLAQIFPRIQSQIVIVVPRKPDGVLSDPFRGDWLRRSLKHRQRSRRNSRRLSRLPASLRPLFVTHGARAGVAQIYEREMGNVAVGPRDIHPAARGQIHLHRFRIGSRGRRLKRGLHAFSIAQQIRVEEALAG